MLNYWDFSGVGNFTMLRINNISQYWFSSLVKLPCCWELLTFFKILPWPYLYNSLLLSSKFYTKYLCLLKTEIFNKIHHSWILEFPLSSTERCSVLIHITGPFCQVPLALHLDLEEMNRFLLRANVELRPWAAAGTGSSILTRGTGHFRTWEEWVRARELAALSWHMVPHWWSPDRQFTGALKLCEMQPNVSISQTELAA